MRAPPSTDRELKLTPTLAGRTRSGAAGERQYSPLTISPLTTHQFASAILRLELERRAVDAIAPAGCFAGPVGEDVAEMAAAAGTAHLGAEREERAVVVLRHNGLGGRPVEAWPAGSRTRTWRRMQTGAWRRPRTGRCPRASRGRGAMSRAARCRAGAGRNTAPVSARRARRRRSRRPRRRSRRLSSWTCGGPFLQGGASIGAGNGPIMTATPDQRDFKSSCLPVVQGMAIGL